MWVSQFSKKESPERRFQYKQFLFFRSSERFARTSFSIQKVFIFQTFRKVRPNVVFNTNSFDFTDLQKRFARTSFSIQSIFILRPPAPDRVFNTIDFYSSPARPKQRFTGYPMRYFFVNLLTHISCSFVFANMVNLLTHISCSFVFANMCFPIVVFFCSFSKDSWPPGRRKTIDYHNLV